MAYFGKDIDDFKGSRCINIRSVEQTEHFTLYVITVTVGVYTWTVKHRYSEFHQLHEKLVASYKLDRSLLPRKKIFGNQTESFIKKRQRELEIYLQTIVLYLAQHIPSCLAYFLDFDKYEIHGITQAMAEDLYSRGESLLLSREKYEVSTLQLYSLTERLKLPEPTCDSGDVKKDLGHILDFITRAKHLKVVCSKKPVGSSNILMSKLPFDLTLFKSLQTLEINGCNFRIVNGLETVKQTVLKFEVHESTSSMKEILLQDAPHWRAEDGSVIVGYWNFITELDFKRNSFLEIHDSIQLMPNVEKLNLSHNMIESILNLHWLSQLTHIDLSHNNIHLLDSLHTKLGNIKYMCLAYNHLETLHGFAKLFSLQTLDVSHNKISLIEELRYVSKLPCIEDLTLEGNPVTSSLDYRTKTLEMFGDRVAEAVLDHKPPDQKELDTIAVLQALRKAKDVKSSKNIQPKKNSSVVSLSDMYSQSFSSSVSDNPDGKSSPTASSSTGMAKSLPKSVTDQHRQSSSGKNQSPSSYSQDSISSFNSVDEKTVQDSLHPSSTPHNPLTDGVDPTNCTNNNSNGNVDNKDGRSGIINPILNEFVPEAHSLNTTIEKPTSYSPSPHKMATSVRCPNSGQVSEIYPPSVPNSHDLDESVCSLTTQQYPPNTDLPATDPVLLVSPESHMIPQSPLRTQNLSQPQPHSIGPSLKRKTTRMFSAADLPTTSNPAFLLWLNKHLFTSGEAAAVESCRTGKESILEVLWCYVEQLSKPSELFPCCAVLSKRKFFIERLTGLESTFPGVPEMKPCCMVSIQNIQQLVLGPCHAFLRLEEAFVGKSGVFTLFGVEQQGLKRFFNKLFNACCDLDIINNYSFVDLTVKSDLLKVIASREERMSGMSSDRLVSAALVQLKNCQDFNFLVLSENRMYCLDLDCIHWPPVSFDTSPDASLSFIVHHEFSITDKIDSIMIHNNEVSFGEGERYLYNWANSHLDFDVRFLHFELSLQVFLSEDNSFGPLGSSSKTSEGISDSSQLQSAHVSYNFASSACRDLFLDRLSTMRAELAHRMSPNIREEPEGGNEQLSPHERLGFKSLCLSLPKSQSSLSSSQNSSLTKEQATCIPKPFHVETASGLTPNELHHLQVERKSSYNSNPDYRFDKKTFHSDSVTSDKSLGTMSLLRSDVYSDSLGHYQTPTNSTTHSPKDDLSMSPMSNFSRASISPIMRQDSEERNKTSYSQTALFRQQMAAAKADSLPSSFDWKQYYFKSYAPTALDTELTSGLAAGNTRSVSDYQSAAVSNINSTNIHFEIQNADRFLEDIESSSEFESSQNSETEHELFLKQCVKSYDLVSPLSTKLKPLCLMNGKELRKFFHSAIAQKLYPDNQEMLSEELHYVLWSMVVSYTDPKHEIITLVMLSTHGIYLVSDTSPQATHKSRPSWMTHSRNRSDSAITTKSGTSPGGRRLVEPYFVFKYKDLIQVNIGLFDQCVRLTGRNEHSIFTIATRDSVLTEKFIQKLKQVLSFLANSPAVERNRTEMENDFYRASVQIKSSTDGTVYTHPSQVKFVYPDEDIVRDILYLVNECIRQRSKVCTSREHTSKLWFYMQCYHLPSDDGRAPDRSQPRSVVITATYFCLAEEDIVTYPLPDFVRGVPENPCHEIIECKRIDSLKRITLFHGNPHIVNLTFLDEPENLVVDVSMQHFGVTRVDKERQHLCPEVTYRLYIQSMKERDRMVQVLDTLWKSLVTQVGRILDITKI